LANKVDGFIHCGGSWNLVEVEKLEDSKSQDINDLGVKSVGVPATDLPNNMIQNGEPPKGACGHGCDKSSVSAVD
tara:strand:- start:338 stop:562 length:225 start_codon:yes stop_codon:yes gene_type:complete